MKLQVTKMTAMENLFKHIPSVIENIEINPFDSHHFIVELAHKHQFDYVLALNEMGPDSPFQKLHAVIGKELSRSLRLKQVKSDVPHKSENIFKKSNEVALWEKR